MNQEALVAVVRVSISKADVIKRLGLPLNGTSYRVVTRAIKDMDTRHFLGQGANSGDRHKGGSPKKHPPKKKVIKLYMTRQQVAEHRDLIDWLRRQFPKDSSASAAT